MMLHSQSLEVVFIWLVDLVNLCKSIEDFASLNQFFGLLRFGRRVFVGL